MHEVLDRREEVNKKLMDLIASLTKIPIGLYESYDGHVEGIIPDASRKNFEEHCHLIQSFPGGRERCEADQCNRAKIGLNSDREQLVCCYAGLYNQLVPIRIGGKTKAVVVYGEMQIEDEELKKKSLENHTQAVKVLGLNEAQAGELKRLLLQAKKYSPEDLETLKGLLIAVEDLLYMLVDEEKRTKRIVERTTHELVTRMQAVISAAENLELELDVLNRKEVKHRCEDIINCTLAYNTVVQTLGEHLEDYSYHKHPIPEIIREAVQTYEAEAQRRGVEIKLSLQRENDSWTEVSKKHLQLAINNLVHNAIKYSFYGGGDKNRFITVSGSPEAGHYKITVYNYGVGILPDEYEDIFKEGYQGKLTEREYRTGSGKGLFFVKRIIDKHHGLIYVESRLMANLEEELLGKPHLNKFTVCLPYKQPRGGKQNA